MKDDLALQRMHSIPPNVVTIETEYTREVLKVKDLPRLEERDLEKVTLRQQNKEAEKELDLGMNAEMERADSTDELFRKE